MAHQRRWPGDDTRTVEQAFAEEQPRLLPLPVHAFSTDRIEAVRSGKTIYIRFDLNDYSIPPEAVGRPLTLVASDTLIRILDGAAEIARHQRTYDRHQQVLDPAHQDAVLQIKRKAFHTTPGGRLAQAAPESEALLDLAFAQGESAGSQTAQLLKLLDIHGAAALRRAIGEALERNTPRASSVAFLLRRQQPTATTIPSHNLPAQLLQLGLHAIPAQMDDFLARAAKARWSPRQVLEQLVQAEVSERSRRSLIRRFRLCGLKSFKPIADFDWTWPAKIERDIVERSLTLDFLSEARNLVLMGRNGLGKTMIAKNICHAAVSAGNSVLFRSAPALLGGPASPDARGPPRVTALRTYANVGLLCIDEAGYLSCDDKAADLLYEVINLRYERKPVILTTNRPFKEWNEVFPNATCIVTLLDRLLHHADVTVIEGDSYRVKESEMETAARRRKK